MAECTYKLEDGNTCGYNVKEGFTLCWKHYMISKGQAEEPKARLSEKTSNNKSQWHDDPVVDALLKINSNLSRIVKVLEKEPTVPTESLFDTRPPYEHDKD